MLICIVNILLIVLLILCIAFMYLQILHEIKRRKVLDDIKTTDKRLNEYIDKIRIFAKERNESD